MARIFEFSKISLNFHANVNATNGEGVRFEVG